MIDSGVAAERPDVAGRVLPGRDVVQDDDTPQDGNGHGSQVSGIAIAGTGNGVGSGGDTGGPSGGAEADGAVKPFVRVRRRQAALRRGVRVRLRAAAGGPARVRVRARGRTARRPGVLRAQVLVRLPGESRDRVRRIRIVG